MGALQFFVLPGNYLAGASSIARNSGTVISTSPVSMTSSVAE